MSIPSLILFKGGQEVARVIGAKPKDAILRDLEPHLLTALELAFAGVAARRGGAH